MTYPLLIELPIDYLVVVVDSVGAAAERIEMSGAASTQVLRAAAIDDRSEAEETSEHAEASSEITDARGDVD